MSLTAPEIEPSRDTCSAPRQSVEFDDLTPAVRVLHFTRTFSQLSETFIYEYVTATARRGFDSQVVTCARVNEGTRPFEPVHEIGWPSGWAARRLAHRVIGVLQGAPSEISYWSAVRDRLAAIVARVRPHVVHAHFGLAAVTLADVAAQLDVPMVATFYGYDASRFLRHAYWRRRYAALWHQTGAVTVLSRVMRRELLRFGCPADRLHVVRLGRDLKQLRYRAPTSPVRHFVSVGRLTEKKGHLDVLDAFRILRQALPDARLTIIGDGELREAITDYVTVHGLNDVVVLRGALPNEDTLTEMARADAFVLASKVAATGDAEGTPTVLIEAQALGLPCVTTRHSGIPEMIPPANQKWLASEGDVEGMADRLLRLSKCDSAALREISLAGRRWVEDRYDVDRSAAVLARIYDHLAGSRPDGGSTIGEARTEPVP